MTLKTKLVLPLFEAALLCFQKNLTNIGDSNFPTKIFDNDPKLHSCKPQW